MSRIWDIEKYTETARMAAAEGCVLLKNDRDALPLKDGERIAVFGRTQFHYYKSGTGSGGSVNTDYVTGIWEALENSGKYELNSKVRQAYEEWIADHPYEEGAGWGLEPWSQEEMPVSSELIRKAAAESDAALCIIGRTAGEDQDNKNEEGSYLLTGAERELIKEVCRAFPRTVILLNTGNIIDMKWVGEYDPAAVLYVWQGGQEGGNAVADVLSGTVNPDGHLTDTVAADIEDYPSTVNFGSETENVQEEDIFAGYRYFETFARERVLYPFGFGLSYTTFESSLKGFEQEGDEWSLRIGVRNTGALSGRHTVQAYCQAPQGRLGKPLKVLCGFAKSGVLEPGAEEILTIPIRRSDLASYDDSGATGHKSAFVLEEGTYRILFGDHVRDTKEAGCFEIKECTVVCQCEEAMAPVKPFERLVIRNTEHGFEKGREAVPLRSRDADPAEKRKRELSECLPFTGDQGYRLKDAENGKISMETFLAQLSDQDLITMIRGEGMCSSKVTPGIAGAYGGVTERLKKFGIPVAGCADGPSGIRMDCGTHAFSLPNGTCLACSFDEEISEKLFRFEALELRKNRIDALLGPGMNIHRNPLNGRNFEYFSEDPYLTGKIAAAQLRGLHAFDIAGVIKHFAGNTQEHLRHKVNMVLSERALREIYLKGFEIAVREGKARAVMSTYGPVNGMYTSSCYDLLTTILRKEWGFTGIVMTDWWAMGNDSAGAPGSYQNVSAQVMAQNDLNMVNANSEENSSGDDLDTALKEGKLTRSDLVRSAANICRHLLTTPVYRHSLGEESELDRELASSLSEEDSAMMNRIDVALKDETTKLDPALIETGKGKTTVFNISLDRRASYELLISVRAFEVAPMAQLPMSIFMNKELLLSVTLNGSDTEWKEIRVPIPAGYQSGYTLKFFFGQSGLQVRSAELILKEDKEDEIRRNILERRIGEQE